MSGDHLLENLNAVYQDVKLYAFSDTTYIHSAHIPKSDSRFIMRLPAASITPISGCTFHLAFASLSFLIRLLHWHRFVFDRCRIILTVVCVVSLWVAKCPHLALEIMFEQHREPPQGVVPILRLRGSNSVRAILVFDYCCRI